MPVAKRDGRARIKAIRPPFFFLGFLGSEGASGASFGAGSAVAAGASSGTFSASGSSAAAGASSGDAFSAAADVSGAGACAGAICSVFRSMRVPQYSHTTYSCPSSASNSTVQAGHLILIMIHLILRGDGFNKTPIYSIAKEARKSKRLRLDFSVIYEKIEEIMHFP